MDISNIDVRRGNMNPIGVEDFTRIDGDVVVWIRVARMVTHPHFPVEVDILPIKCPEAIRDIKRHVTFNVFLHHSFTVYKYSSTPSPSDPPYFLVLNPLSTP